MQARSRGPCSSRSARAAPPAVPEGAWMAVPTKKKLTVSQAAHQWVRVKRRMAELKPELEEAAEVLFEHFERTGRNAYKDLIGFSESTSTVLDQSKVRAFLGKK